MKKISASLFAKKILLGLCLSGMAGCSSMPHVFGANEVPEGAINAPRLVSQPSPDVMASPLWPRVGDVPSNPNDFSLPPDIAQSMNEMENSRVDAANARMQSGIALAPETSKASKTTPQLPGF